MGTSVTTMNVTPNRAATPEPRPSYAGKVPLPRTVPVLLVLAAGLMLSAAARVQEPSEAVSRPSFEDGVAKLEEATRSWREERGCVSCHTNGWALAAQPVIAPDSPEFAAGRTFAEGYLQGLVEDWDKPDKKRMVEGVVATSAFLAMSDARSGQAMHEATRRGLDHSWTLLDESGTWEDWLQCNWPPFESDTEFGPTLVLVALGEVRSTSELGDQDLEGAKQLIAYLRDTPPVSLHSKAMRVWAGISWPDALRKSERRIWRRELVRAQASDGGWSMASLSGPDWKRDDGEGQVETSEAYATAFATYVLLRSGTEPSDPVVREGLDWLREHQREGGDWFTRSPRRDGKHYISRAATTFALMALAEGETEDR